MEELLFRGHPDVVDADLADYFGSIPHIRLLRGIRAELPEAPPEPPPARPPTPKNARQSARRALVGQALGNVLCVE